MNNGAPPRRKRFQRRLQPFPVREQPEDDRLSRQFELDARVSLARARFRRASVWNKRDIDSMLQNPKGEERLLSRERLGEFVAVFGMVFYESMNLEGGYSL